MRIEITNLNLRELLEVIKNFDTGKVVVDNEKAYWEFELKHKQQLSPQQNSFTPNTPGVVNNMGNSLDRMQKALFGAFS